MPNVRAIVFTAALLLLPCAASAQQAQSWPSRPVTVLVPFPAGGTADLLARETAQALSEQLGQQFVVENRTGGAGNLAGAAVAKAAPDGYTILFSSHAQAAINKFMFPNLPYDPARELIPIVVVAKAPIAIVAGLSAPVKSFQEMVDQAKAAPNKLPLCHAGNGSMGHIAGELLQQKTGIKLTPVPYRGGPQMATDLLGGHVSICSDLVSNFVQLAKDGKVRMLAVTSANRVSDLPDVPTVAEQIHAPFDATAWFAYTAPAGTPAEIVQKINAIANRYLQSAKGKDLFARQAMQAGGGTPAETAAFVKLELEKWQPVIEAAHISLN